ncbi:hypothetical protein CLF_104578 [Clonorchis sinensis]|uniref:Uncharacterized protein n=1 Tax=Clonorchis sinensis TaxID=79923 RepID=H2KQS2_CLOSI|nr:hypothetical protein CLF_104578 [Clonorchis sinensis]
MNIKSIVAELSDVIPIASCQTTHYRVHKQMPLTSPMYGYQEVCARAPQGEWVLGDKRFVIDLDDAIVMPLMCLTGPLHKRTINWVDRFAYTLCDDESLLTASMENLIDKSNSIINQVPQVDAVGKPDERLRWNQNLNRVKHPLDRYRPWANDRSGLRLLDCEASEVDCLPPKLGNFDYLPVCFADPSPLTQHFNALDNLNAQHPRYLLEHYIYRDPDEYHIAKEEGKYACYLDCDAREFRELKPMNQREIMRLRFATNNYRTFDDWKEDPNDELLAQFDSTKTNKEAAL